MKKKLIISLLSLVLVLAVMLGMLPAASLTVHAATQVGGFDNYKFFNYSDGATLYYSHDGYLYKVVLTNMKNTNTVAIDIYNRYNNFGLFADNEPLDYSPLFDESYNIIDTADLPATDNGSISVYLTSGSKRLIDAKKPFATITRIAVDEPEWEWTFGANKTSVKAIFNIEGADAYVSVNGTVTSTTVLQEMGDCTQNLKRKHTASAKYSGKEFTTETIEIGAAGAHDFQYTVENNAIIETCKNTCGHYAAAAIQIDGDVTYNGNPHRIAEVVYTGDWNGGTVEPNYETQVVDSGVVKVSITAGGVTARDEFKINPFPLENTEIKVDPGYVYYDGRQNTPEVTVVFNGRELVLGEDYELTTESGAEPVYINAGSYIFIIRGKGNFAGDVDKAFSIYRKDIRDAEVTLDQDHFVYNGTAQKPKATVRFEGVELVEGRDYEIKYLRARYTDSYGNPTSWYSSEQECINAYSDYFAVIEGIGNYYVSIQNRLNAPFVIEKMTPAAPVVDKIDETISGKEDGKILGVDETMEYREEDRSSYRNITGSRVTGLEAGTYYVRYKSNSNCNASEDTVVVINPGRKLKINVPEPQIGYSLTTDAHEFDYWNPIDLYFELKEGFDKLENFSVYIADGIGHEFYDPELDILTVYPLEDISIVVEGVADITPPTAEIRMGDKKWDAFHGGLTEKMIFTKAPEVTVSAWDTAGIKSIEYYLASEELSLEDLKNIDYWEGYNGTFNITTNGTGVLYAKVTDIGDNVVYVNTDAMLLDDKAPTLEGIEDGETYYGDLIVIKSEEQFYDIDEVTVDGEKLSFLEGTYGLIPADNKEHTVVVKDALGNETVYKVTVMKVYTVTFMDGDSVFGTVEVKHGEKPEVPEPPVKRGYTVKWEEIPEDITEDITVKAVYVKNSGSQPPNTGDESGLWLWVALLAVSCAGAAGVLFAARKRRFETK